MSILKGDIPKHHDVVGEPLDVWSCSSGIGLKSQDLLNEDLEVSREGTVAEKES